MPVFFFMVPSALTVSAQKVFVSSEEILGAAGASQSFTTTVAALSGFSVGYLDGSHGIQELQVQLSAMPGNDNSGSNAPGVWVTPIVDLVSSGGDPISFSIWYTLIVTWDAQRIPATALVPATTAAASPPVAAGGTPVGLPAAPIWMFAALNSFDLMFSDGMDHFLYETSCYVAASPSSGNTASVLGAISINDDSGHAGVAGVGATVVAFQSAADGYPYTQSLDLEVAMPSGTIAQPYGVFWPVPADAQLGSWAVLLTGFRISNGPNSDTKISSLTARVTAGSPLTTPGTPGLTLPVTVTALAQDGSSVNQVSGSVALTAVVMVANPGLARIM